MWNVGFIGTLARCGTQGFPDTLDFLFFAAFDALGLAARAERNGGFIAVLLEGLDFTGEAALELDEFGVFFGGGDEFAHEIGPQENGREAGSGRLEADFREFGRIMAAEKAGQVVLKGAEFEGALPGDGPFFVPAAGFPVRDVAFRDGEAAFLKGGDDFAVGEIVRQHAIDHVAFEHWKMSDLAIARLARGAGLERLERGGSEPETEQSAFGGGRARASAWRRGGHERACGGWRGKRGRSGGLGFEELWLEVLWILERYHIIDCWRLGGRVQGPRGRRHWRSRSVTIGYYRLLWITNRFPKVTFGYRAATGG